MILKGNCRLISIFLSCLIIISVHAQLRVSYLQQGRYELSNGHYTEAIEKLNAAITFQPYLYEGYFLRGFSKYQLYDFLGAEKDYTKAISICPGMEDLFFYRAITRDRLSDFNGALDDYQKAI